MHDETATLKRSPESSETIIPTTSAARPDHMESVADMIAGNVITASVTYGT